MGVVRDAVIVAAGLGTRMLPTSAYVPKELLPLVDLPVMHHLIFEAKHAGCDRVHIITSPSKDFSSLRENLNTTYSMYSKGSDHLNPLDDMDIFFHTQHEQNGLGHAIMMAREAIDGPFLVLLGDNILTSSHAILSEFQASNVSKQLVRLYEEHDQPSASVYNVGINRVNNYGIVLMKEGRIVSIVEKPSKEEAPSTYALCGRYVFAKNTFELLDRYSVEEYGELQSIALMKHWMDSGHLHAHVLPDSVSWYDSGLPFEWLKSQIDHALRRPEYAEELQEWLNKRLG